MEAIPKPIRDYIDRLDGAAQERLLTGTLIACSLSDRDDPTAGCLVGVARGAGDAWRASGCSDNLMDWPSEVRGAIVGDLATGIQSVFDAWYCGLNSGAKQQAIRDYIVELRLTRGGTVPEPAMVNSSLISI